MTKQIEIETIRENAPSSDSPLERLVIRQPQSIATNEDCMNVMKRYPDKFFALAIVDPPYGIGGSRGTGGYSREWLNNVDKGWDTERPTKEYWEELFRVSENQIVWGGNYFSLPISRGWICWYKTDEVKGRDFSEFELAWTSFDVPARHYEHRPFIRNGERIHPTQKPIALYDWTLSHYAQKGYNILDTHLGSGSSRIACHKAGLEFLGCEKNAQHLKDEEKRWNEYLLQLPMQFAAV